MKAQINKNIVHITGSIKEQSRIEGVVKRMMSEFSSMCLIEATAGAMCDYTMSYSSDETTVQTVKESYAEAKKSKVFVAQVGVVAF